MKLTRVNVVLLVLVMALAALELARGRGGAPPREVGRLFPEFFVDQAERVEVVGPDGTLELRQGEAGWVCASRFGHPARADWTGQLTRALASLTTLDLLSDDPGRHGDYGLDEGATRVRVWNESGELVVDLIQGDDTPDASRACYVRRFGDDAVYRAPSLERIPAEPARWLDSMWLSFEPAVIKAVRVVSPDLEAPLELTREDKRYIWSDGDRTVAKRKVDSLLDAARGLFVSDVVAGPADGALELGEVALRLELTRLNDVVLVGEFSEAQDGVVRARRRDPDGWVVELPAKSVELLVERALGL